MSGSSANPKVFISYSQTNLEHVKWVIDLATRLMGDGINVTLDKWHLKPGHDAYAFMEQMVTNQEINHVLLVCDEAYQKKANERKGGVGTESQIISKEIYNSVKQEKFIPVLPSRNSDGKDFTPAFVSSRIYIDLSHSSKYEEEYDNLVRHLWNKPLHTAPALGSMPSHLQESIVPVSPAIAALSRYKHIVESGRPYEAAMQDVFERIEAGFSEHRIFSDRTSEFDELVLKSIEAMTPLRDCYIDLLDTELKHGNFTIETHLAFFENLLRYFSPPENASSWHDNDFDNFKFFAYELCLYFGATLLKHARYSDLSAFLKATMFFNKRGNLEPTTVLTAVRSYVRSLNETRNQRLGLRRTSVVADEVKRRATKTTQFHKLQEADALFYVISRIEGAGTPFWWPVTLVHMDECETPKVDLFLKLVSTRHYEC